MLTILPVRSMRESDAATIRSGVPSRELMYRAGVGIFEAAEWRGEVAIVAGSGNNAGDGYVLALLLADAGRPCRIFRVSDRFSEDGAYYHGLCAARGIPSERFTEETDLSGYGTVVDCLLGTGFCGEVTGMTKCAIEAINAAGEGGAYVVSADINSGLDGDSGCAVTAVRSDLTVSVEHFQPGHFLGSAKDLMKARVSVGIGIRPIGESYGLFEASDTKRVLTPRKNDSHKATYGYVALIGGSERYSGAIRLASMAEAAMRSGAGVATVAAPRSLAPVILPAILESTFFPLSEVDGGILFCDPEFRELVTRYRAIVFGMGVGNTRETARAVSYLLGSYEGTLVLDADGLNALAKLPRALLNDTRARVILTPHPLEFARLAGTKVQEVLAAPIETAKRYAAETGTVVLLKGPTTVVTDGRGVLLVDRGCAGMATAGSGDVLSGVLAGLCGAHPDEPLYAAATGAYLNGLAGELAEAETGAISMTAGDTARKIAEAVRRVTDGYGK